MANYDELRVYIQNSIKGNGNREITGFLLQDVLLRMVDELGTGILGKVVKLGDLSDVNLANLVDKQSLVFSESSGLWTNKSNDLFEFDEKAKMIKAKYGLYSMGAIVAGGKSSKVVPVAALADLRDIRLGTLQDGQVLVYDAASGKWVNKSGGAGGGGGSAALEVPVTTDVAVGYIKKSYTLPEGMTFTEFVQMMFSQAIKKTLPSVTLGGVPTEAIEVGSEVTLFLSATYKDGQFVNTDTGVTPAGCEPGIPAYVLDGSTITTIPHIFTASTTMMHSVEVTQPYGASTAEVKNSAGDVVDESISAGTATDTASFIVGYRAFWGYMTDDEAENLTSELVRGLEHRDTIIDPTKGKITLLQGDDTVPAGQDLMIAIPSSYILSEVVNKDDINFAEGFVLSSLTVQCAGDAEALYNVYRFDNQSAYPMDIKKITIEEA